MDAKSLFWTNRKGNEGKRLNMRNEKEIWKSKYIALDSILTWQKIF